MVSRPSRPADTPTTSLGRAHRARARGFGMCAAGYAMVAAFASIIGGPLAGVGVLGVLAVISAAASLRSLILSGRVRVARRD